MRWPEQRTRIDRIKQRAAAVLLYLQLNGPANLTTIAAAIDDKVHRARYAVVSLRQDGLAYLHSTDKVMGHDGIPRHVQNFASGNGMDWEGLNYRDTQHLQSVLMDWMATRTPDYIVGDDGYAIDTDA